MNTNPIILLGNIANKVFLEYYKDNAIGSMINSGIESIIDNSYNKIKDIRPIFAEGIKGGKELLEGMDIINSIKENINILPIYKTKTKEEILKEIEEKSKIKNIIKIEGKQILDKITQNAYKEQINDKNKENVSYDREL